MNRASIPFLWEQTPRKSKDHHHMATTFIEKSDRTKALDIVSSTPSYGERLSNISRWDVILENRDVIMSRFLSDAKAIAMKQKKEIPRVKENKKKKQSIALQRVSMAINQDLKYVNDDYDDDHNHVSTKNALFGLCSKNSLDVINPVLSRFKTCQNLGVKLVHETRSPSASAIPRILRSNRVMGKSQEPYPKPRFSIENSKISLSNSGGIVCVPRKTSTDRFLVEEVKRRRSENLSKVSQRYVTQPPLPRTPTESWLCRTLPRSSAAIVVSGQATSFKTNPQSIKWETIVKTSYKHIRYSKELNVVHPSYQRNL